MNVSDEHDVHSHMFRPTITDMQDKYCGNCFDIYLIQSQYKGKHKRGGRVTSFVVAAAGRNLCILALNKVNIEAVTTVLVVHVGNGSKVNLQGRQTTRLGSGVFVIHQMCRIPSTSIQRFLSFGGGNSFISKKSLFFKVEAARRAT